MSQQLNIFELPIVAAADEPMPAPEVPEAPAGNPHLEDWQSRKAAYYLRIMGRIARSNLPNAVKRCELSRLSKLRSEIEVP